MITVIKTFIILSALAVFTYTASLALQGELERERAINDFSQLKSYLKTEFGALTKSLF